MQALTKFQKTFKAKRKTNEVDRLNKQFQSQTSSVLSEYQSDIDKKKGIYDEQVKLFDTNTKAYQSKLDDYNKKLAVYKQTLDDINNFRGDWVAVPITGSEYRHTKVRIDPAMKIINPYTSQGWTHAGSIGLGIGDEIYFDVLEQKLPSSTKYENGQAYIQVRKADPADIGTFTEKAPVAPTAPDLTMSKELQEKKVTYTNDYEREIAERKAARVGAVSQKVKDRPMLSKGVTP